MLDLDVLVGGGFGVIEWMITAFGIRFSKNENDRALSLEFCCSLLLLFLYHEEYCIPLKIPAMHT